MSNEGPSRRRWHAVLRELVRYYSQLQAEAAKQRAAGREAERDQEIAALKRRMRAVELKVEIILGED